MRFLILGPLDITADDGSTVTVSRPLHRSALACLLRGAGRPCSVGQMIADLWGEAPPLRPEVSLRSCVYGVRQLLPDAGRLRTHPSGYLIEVAPGELDLHDFLGLARAGRSALDQGDPRRAAMVLGQAIGLWREPPLADLPAGPATARLLDQFKEARDVLLDARLALGRHRQVLGELRGAVAAEPLREHTWAQLMIALYRCGARAEALAAFSRIRITLVSTYGIEPGPELQDLHRRVLADDPTLLLLTEAEARAGATADCDPWQPVCQLPASVPDFTGREAELAVLRDRLPGDGMAITVLGGMPGIGKTALAVHAAHLARPAFPDGQLFASLTDDGLRRDPHDILGELLRGLGVPADQIPFGHFEREARYRSVLAGRRVLVLADGATSAAQVRPLLPGTAGSAVIVTSRARLADLDGARLIELGDLLPADSVSLLRNICDRSLTGPELAAAQAVAGACAHLPLAVRIAGARLADDPHLTVAALAEQLRDAAKLLDALVIGDQSVRARLAAAASAVSATARRVLALLTVAGQRDFSGSLIDMLLEDPRGRDVAAVLADAGLLRRVTGSAECNPGGHSPRLEGCPPRQAPDGPIYRMHPLVRAIAGQLLADAEPGLVSSATARLLAAGWLELAADQARSPSPRREQALEFCADDVRRGDAGRDPAAHVGPRRQGTGAGAAAGAAG